MPRFNQQGPGGNGPMTGRKMGKCTNYDGNNSSSEEQITENQSGCGCGSGFGMRRRRGFGQGHAAQSCVESEGQGFGKRCGGRRGKGRSGQGQCRKNLTE